MSVSVTKMRELALFRACKCCSTIRERSASSSSDKMKGCLKKLTKSARSKVVEGRAIARDSTGLDLPAVFR